MHRVCFVVFIFSFFELSLLDFTLIKNKRQAEFLSEEVENFVIVRPQKVTLQGNLLTNDVRHIVKRGIRRLEDERVHYKVPLPASDLFLSLSANDNIVAPSFVVERRQRGNTTMTMGTPNERHCLFRGSINGTSKSYVALATCYGLTGLINTGEEGFFIEPVKGHELSDLATQPHVIYKTSALKTFSKAGTCGNNDGNEKEIELEEQRRMFHETQTKRRKILRKKQKRSVSRERNVETLVVADKEMIDYYANEDIETYILTVMNMVSALFHDASIGNAINIVLVRLMLLESEELENKEEELLISQHADDTLKSFCKWQKFVNPKDEDHPNHHDVAILLTRYNICSKTNEPCSTLGLAEVAGMCQPHRSCNVNEDTGLALAYTIAHEMGHNFGMSHDNPENGCQAPLGEKQHVMSPHLNSDASPFVWSNCSRWEITKFLDRDWGSCLDDEPSEHEFTFPQLPPGAMYDADHQCRLQYGSDAEFCEGIQDVCQTLWCRKENKCVTRLEPAAEGTFCDKNMWCHMGVCTLINDRPNAIDGEWGPWSSWSECSRTCGAGVQKSERYCDNPTPAWGGRFCIGERKRYKICHTEKCPENSISYRALQCKRFNDIPYKDELHSWLPVSTPITPCQLHCKPDGQFFSVMLADTVEDGTECNPGTRDICINGKCRKVACDWGIDSKAMEDRCGICHGDGTQCLTLKGEFKQKTGLGYVPVVTVPKGARNIRVEELAEATNYIAVRGEAGDFYLNGQWFIQWSGEYQAAGTMLYYQRDGEKETLQIPGAIKEDIRILLLYQSENPGLIYEYTVPNKNATRKPEFDWKYSDWTICSETCGGGIQVSKAECLEKEGGKVEEDYCDAAQKPPDKTRLCNKHECPAKWWTGPWQHCTVTCGDNGIRQRTVICIRSLGSDEQIALLESECDDSDRPSDHEPCEELVPCQADDSWNAGQWTDVCQEDPCNYQSRHVYCSHPAGQCEEKFKPAARRQCGNITCGNWVVGAWSQCSVSCGEGIRFRNVSCVGGVVCHKATEPPSRGKCQTRLCSSTEAINSAEESDSYGNLSNPDDLDNWIPVDLGQALKHSSEKLKKDVRPKEVAKDVVYHPIYEIENPTFMDDSPLSDNKVDGTQMRNEHSVIAYVFEDEEPEREKYFWKVTDWSECSEPCDGGRRHRQAICLDMVTRHVVADSLCDPYSKPATEKPCNIEPCFEWITSEWGQCSAKCNHGVMRREVYCPKPSLCKQRTRPPETKPCIMRPCLQWVEGPWGQCSASCGGGIQVRQVKCVDFASQNSVTGCDPLQKPNHRQSCSDRPCPKTRLEFSQCKDKMDSALCKSLLHMCPNYYFKIKCCLSCTQMRKGLPTNLRQLDSNPM